MDDGNVPIGIIALAVISGITAVAGVLMEMHIISWLGMALFIGTMLYAIITAPGGKSKGDGGAMFWSGSAGDDRRSDSHGDWGGGGDGGAGGGGDGGGGGG